MSTINITLHNTDNSTRVLKHSRLIAGLQSHFPGFIPYNTKTQLFRDKENMCTVYRKCTNGTLHLLERQLIINGNCANTKDDKYIYIQNSTVSGQLPLQYYMHYTM